MSSSDNAKAEKTPIRKNNIACSVCRGKHIKCVGGNPCNYCSKKGLFCEFIEPIKKVVVSLKYLLQLQDDIQKLKKENSSLLSKLHQQTTATEEKNSVLKTDNNISDKKYENTNSLTTTTINDEPIESTFAQRSGRLIKLTGQKTYFVGSSSMTLFGLEIESMIAKYVTDKIIKPLPTLALLGGGSNNNTANSNLEDKNRIHSSEKIKSASFAESKNDSASGLSTYNIASSKNFSDLNDDTDVDNNMKIDRLSSTSFLILIRSDKFGMEMSNNKTEAMNTNLSDDEFTWNKNDSYGIEIVFPSFPTALLLLDTVIRYNGGCYYFFNEGLEISRLKLLYDGKLPFDLENDKIKLCIWFCKIFLIFAIGEIYLGPQSIPRNANEGKQNKGITDILTCGLPGSMNGTKINLCEYTRKGEIEDEATVSGSRKPFSDRKRPRNTNFVSLPGYKFYQQMSEIFDYIYNSDNIENVIMEGSIETLLLYSFYLQIADRTIGSYFYFNQALRACLILGYHVDAQSDTLTTCELEHNRRLWWTVYMFERMLSSKAGLPLSLTDYTISTGLPQDIDMTACADYLFSAAWTLNTCINIIQINARILNEMYQTQPSDNILPLIKSFFKQLTDWRTMVSGRLEIDFTLDDNDFVISRICANIFTEYFQGVNLLIRPLLFHFTAIQLKRFKDHNTYLNLQNYSSTIVTLLNFSLQASINTIRSLWYLMGQNKIAIFGYMDREYLFTSSATLLLFNAVFGIHEQTFEHLDHALTIFNTMKQLGNQPAQLRRAQLLTLIINLDFHDIMKPLILKHISKDEMTSNLFDTASSSMLTLEEINKQEENVSKRRKIARKPGNSRQKSNLRTENDLDRTGFGEIKNSDVNREKNSSSHSTLNSSTTLNYLNLYDNKSSNSQLPINKSLLNDGSTDVNDNQIPLSDINKDEEDFNIEQNKYINDASYVPDIVSTAIAQSFSAPLTETGTKIIEQNVNQLDMIPSDSLGELLVDLNHLSSSENQLWKDISDQAMWLGNTMDPTAPIETMLNFFDNGEMDNNITSNTD